jgi:hypothetical protein
VSRDTRPCRGIRDHAPVPTRPMLLRGYTTVPLTACAAYPRAAPSCTRGPSAPIVRAPNESPRRGRGVQAIPSARSPESVDRSDGRGGRLRRRDGPGVEDRQQQLQQPRELRVIGLHDQRHVDVHLARVVPSLRQVRSVLKYLPCRAVAQQSGSGDPPARRRGRSDVSAMI